MDTITNKDSMNSLSRLEEPAVKVKDMHVAEETAFLSCEVFFHHRQQSAGVALPQQVDAERVKALDVRGCVKR
jgi:hypothetical protein